MQKKALSLTLKDDLASLSERWNHFCKFEHEGLPTSTLSQLNLTDVEFSVHSSPLAPQNIVGSFIWHCPEIDGHAPQQLDSTMAMNRELSVIRGVRKKALPSQDPEGGSSPLKNTEENGCVASSLINNIF
ncbi:hypothetical protein TNCV_3285441 [Trichonephila clavipes]|nr:hypothetical protein TNCV_3285441 [Trichonephila clavipes]